MVMLGICWVVMVVIIVMKVIRVEVLEKISCWVMIVFSRIECLLVFV